MLPVESGKITQVHPFRGPSGQGASMRVRYRRGTGDWVQMTTPTIVEKDPTNCPGSFTLLMDEGMTISAGFRTEVMSFWIDMASGAMQPVEFHIWLFKNLSAEIMAVAGTGDLEVGGAAPESPIGLAG